MHLYLLLLSVCANIKDQILCYHNGVPNNLHELLQKRENIILYLSSILIITNKKSINSWCEIL